MIENEVNHRDDDGTERATIDSSSSFFARGLLGGGARGGLWRLLQGGASGRPEDQVMCLLPGC